MRALGPSFIFLLIAMFSQTARAGFRPSFGADSAAWRSSDIVLVSTLPAEGTFEVIEAWKGNLRAGARILVPQLIPDAAALPIPLHPTSLEDALRGSDAEQVPRRPTGSHMVLFLKRNPSGSDKTEWEAADVMDSMKASVVWIQGDKLFCFVQVNNPGPSVLEPMFSYSLEKLKQRVDQVIRTQEEMQSIVAGPAGEQKPRLLKPFVHSDINSARRLALSELGKSGPTAVPVILEMLDDAAYAEQGQELVKELVNSGGQSIGGELIGRFRRDVEFWESTGPSLPVGWWNQDTNPDAPLRSRYGQTYQLVIELQKIRDRNALALAERLHALWISHPQLDDPSGLNQMSLECEKLVMILKSTE
jgi:hypothetical protein